MDVRGRWKSEKDSAWLYRVVADCEPDPVRKKLFAALGAAAEDQAGILLGDIRKTDPGAPAETSPSLRFRLVGRLTRWLGPRRVRPLLAASKVRGLSVYAARAARPQHPVPVSVSDIGSRHRRAGGSGTLRAAVFGVNDGLVSNTSLIMGVAGASADERVILLSGVAGALAGAFSMAAGEYVSVRSQRELYEFQIGQERDELARYPKEEAEELALIYAARGIPVDEARRMSGIIFQDHEQALDALAREELGLNPDDLGSPAAAGLSSFVAFSAGAVVPLLPFLAGGATAPVPAAATLSALGLFGVGSALSLFSGRGALRGGLRMLLIGAAASTATHLVGRLLGVAILS